MTAVFQLYGRPLGSNSPLPPLSITGDLEVYSAGEPYEGRLQIVNSVGKCVVEIVESSLPPGSYAFVDNFTKEIVLRWPAYTPPDALASGVPNGDFELGDNGMWRKGAGWTIEAGGAESGSYSGVFANHRGTSLIESARVPYNLGTTITASCRFQQGASSKGNLLGRILLIWCDKDGNMVPGGEGVSFNGGNLIRSGSNSEWQTSSVTAQSKNPLVHTVAVGLSAERRKQNKLARVDNFTWDHEYSVGTASSLDFTVTFKVTDSANRVAYWSGTVGQHLLFFTSRLYPLNNLVENMTSGIEFGGGYLRESPTIDVLVDGATSNISILGGELTSLARSCTQLPDLLTSAVAITGGELRSLTRTYTVSIEKIASSLSITGGRLKTTLITQTTPVENITSTLSITGGTLV